MIEISIAREYLTIIITSLGILVGFLILFLQHVPERRRRIIDIILAKKIDFATSDLTKITVEEGFLDIIQRTINYKNIKVNIFNHKIDLSKIVILNIIIFVYTIFIFLGSLFYLMNLYLCNSNLDDITLIDGDIILLLTILTIINYLLLIMMVLFSCVFDYEIPIKKD